MSPPRALLANEAGGGRGHVALLAAAARALRPEAACLAALGRPTHADELSGLCETVLRAPLLARQPGAARPFALPGSASWGDVLAEIGLTDPERLHLGLDFWRELITGEDISLLIADFAPLALRAALGLRDEGWDIRIVSLGTGYTTPPPGLHRFPLFLADHDRIAHAEADTLERLNAAGAAFGWEPLPRLSALYDCDLSLAATFSFLDPYPDRPASGRLPPLVPAARRIASGDGVFVYFSTREAIVPTLVEALAALPLPRRGYLPRSTPEVAARLAATGMELLDRPATADEIADYARLILHAAPHGTVAMAALAGLPQVGVPQHLEQLYTARQAETQGILRIALPGGPDLAGTIAASHADAAFAVRARQVAAELRRDHPAEPTAPLRSRLLPLLAEVRAWP